MHRLASRCLLLASLVLFAGCTAPAASVDEPVDPATEVPVVSLKSRDPPVSGTGIHFEASGPAGSWMVLYAPFLGAPDEVEMEYSFRLTAEAGDGPQGLLFWYPGLTDVYDGMEALDAFPFEERILDFPEGGAELMRDGGMSAMTSASFGGIFTAVASEAPWTLSYDTTASAPFGDAVFLQGEGASFTRGADRMLGLPVIEGDFVDDASHNAEILEPGWTHLEVLTRVLQPDGIRNIEVAFPDGTHFESEGMERGHTTPVGGSAGSSGWIDHAGTLRDIPGTATAHALYAGTRMDLEFGTVHIPLNSTALPERMVPGYAGSGWPFPDEWPPVVYRTWET